MAVIQLIVKIEDDSLSEAIRFLGANTDQDVQNIKDEYFKKPIEVDFNDIADKQKRYYHTNGLTALLIMVQDEIK